MTKKNMKNLLRQTIAWAVLLGALMTAPMATAHHGGDPCGEGGVGHFALCVVENVDQGSDSAFRKVVMEGDWCIPKEGYDTCY